MSTFVVEFLRQGQAYGSVSATTLEDACEVCNQRGLYHFAGPDELEAGGSWLAYPDEDAANQDADGSRALARIRR